MSNNNLTSVIDKVGAQIKILKSYIQAIKSDSHDLPFNNTLINNVHQISVPKTAQDKINSQFKDMIKQVKIDSKNKIVVEQWVGNLMRISVEEAHKQYFMKDDQISMRLQFATLILQQYSKFIIQARRIQEMAKTELKKEEFNFKLLQDFENIFKTSSANAIEYLQHKYQTKKNKISDKKLTQQIKQTQKLIDPKFDLLFRSNTTLPIHSPNLLRKDLKIFLNKAINECHEKWPMFKKDMINIFNPKGNTDLHYQIGTKIPKSTQPYTQQQLKQPGFFIKGNEMMRVMMKWIQELLDFFQNQNRFKDNKGGFRINGQKQMKKLITEHRNEMWNRFSDENKRIVKKKLEALKNEINSTISSIILTSNNQIRNIQSLNKSIIGLLIVSENIWKALENYMMGTLVILFTSFFNIKIRYEQQKKNQSDLQIFTFMLGDLFRCKCSGTRQEILAVWRNLKQKQSNNEIRILRVKNRLNQSTNDFLINFAYVDPQKCFLICQMQMALAQKTNNDDKAYHFKHFLYQMARSPHGVGVQLAIMLYYHDNRKKYLKKHQLMIQAPLNMFVYKQQTQKIVCKQCDLKNSSLKQKNKQLSYMCSNCCKLIQGYTFFFNGHYCPKCNNTICPLCYLKLFQIEKSLQWLLKNVKNVTKYFKPKQKLYLQQNITILENDIQRLIKQNKFVVVLYYRKHSGIQQIEVIKQIPSTNYYSKIFSNSPFKIKEQLSDSIIILLTPIFPPCVLSNKSYLADIQNLKNARDLIVKSQERNIKQLKQYFKYQVVDSYLHQKFDSKSNKDFIVLKNKQDSKCFIVDYIVEQRLDIQKYIANNQMKQIIQQINKDNSKNQRLILVNLQNPELLKEIANKQLIKEIEIQQSFQIQKIEECNQYKVLDLFTQVNSLVVYKTPSFKSIISYSFDNCLQQLVVRNCNIKSEAISSNYYPLLQKLDLSNNLLTQIPCLQFVNIESIALSNNLIKSIDFIKQGLQKLTRIVLKSNKISQLPVLNLSSLQILNLSHNEITSFQNISYFNTPSLIELSLTNNESIIQKVVPDFNNIPNLLNVYLSYNNISISLMQSHPTITELRLDHNIIKQIKIKDMPKLSTLDISFNRLTEQYIRPLLTQLQLQVLLLYGNNMKSFPHDIKSKIQYIKIEAKLLNQKQQRTFRPRNSSCNVTLKCYICGKSILGITMHYNDKGKEIICNDKKCLTKWNQKNLNFKSKQSIENEIIQQQDELIQLVEIRKSTGNLI